MSVSQVPLTEGESRVEEIPTSPKTVTYYSLAAAPLFAVWFIGLLVFLLWTYKNIAGQYVSFLFQALALSALVYLIMSIARWLYRVDVSQRDAYLTNKGVWIHVPGKEWFFISVLSIVSVREKNDWMATHLHLEGIEIRYREAQKQKSTLIIGVENAPVFVKDIQGKLAPTPA